MQVIQIQGFIDTVSEGMFWFCDIVMRDIYENNSVSPSIENSQQE
jgi:hypothetical protein